ncbi:hypothetical protein NKH77_08795 [Streptomyces sp. M19]
MAARARTRGQRPGRQARDLRLEGGGQLQAPRRLRRPRRLDGEVGELADRVRERQGPALASMSAPPTPKRTTARSRRTGTRTPSRSPGPAPRAPRAPGARPRRRSTRPRTG